MNIEIIMQEYIKDGYTRPNATAKACQDIILMEISKSSYFNNVTIKGGVVMQSLSNDKRRATRDIDLDFIKYSLDDESIKQFIEKLNKNDDGITIHITGLIEKLHHQDYDGKRVNIIIQDSYNNKVETKLDIGVHKNFDVIQDEYCFDLNSINSIATLFVNSKEQIFIEKLKSLLKFGVLSTRYKDIFDFYYLINKTNMDKEKFNKYLNEIIFQDNSIKVNNLEEILLKLQDIFSNRLFIKNLNNARNNWLGIPVEEAIETVLNYINNLETVLNT